MLIVVDVMVNCGEFVFRRSLGGDFLIKFGKVIIWSYYCVVVVMIMKMSFKLEEVVKFFIIGFGFVFIYFFVYWNKG